MRENEKLLVMSNFSFSHSVFKRLVLQTCKNQGLFGKGLKDRIVCKRLIILIKKALKFETSQENNNLHLYNFPTIICTLPNSLPHNPELNDPETDSFLKHYGKTRKCWSAAFSLFPIKFSTLLKTRFITLATINLSSAICFHFVQGQNFVMW